MGSGIAFFKGLLRYLLLSVIMTVCYFGISFSLTYVFQTITPSRYEEPNYLLAVLLSIVVFFLSYVVIYSLVLFIMSLVKLIKGEPQIENSSDSNEEITSDEKEEIKPKETKIRKSKMANFLSQQRD